METNICFSTFQYDPASPGKAGAGSSRRVVHPTALADGCLVPPDASAVDRSTSPLTTGEEDSPTGPHRQSPSSSQKPSTSSSFLIRDAVKAQGFSDGACEIICASWRPATTKQYSSYLRRWCQFCTTRDLDPLRPTVDTVLTFLTHLYHQGIGYSAINTARSAISAITLNTLGSHPCIVRFMKGIFELRTPLPKYTHTWDVAVLLEHLRKLKTNASLSLKELSKKVCALLLLSTAQRVQTVHLIRLGCVLFHNQGCTISLVDKLKHTRPGHHQKALELSIFHDDEKVCVVNCLKEYIKRTEKLRKNTDQLLLCYVRPHGPASKDTISRWLKEILSDAGIENFAPHSFRGASSSAMLASGVTLDDILKSAGWTNASTFHKFYNRIVESKLKEGQCSQTSIYRYFKEQEK